MGPVYTFDQIWTNVWKKPDFGPFARDAAQIVTLILIYMYLYTKKFQLQVVEFFADTFLTWSHTQVVLFPFVFVSKSDLGGYPIDLLRLRDACPHCLVVIEYSKIYA